MFESLRKRKHPYIEDQILNDGLAYAMEFGEKWLHPIQSRLTKLYPKLTEEELNYYNKVCREAMDTGHALVYDLVEKCGKADSSEQFKSDFMAIYPWINKKNLGHLYGQGRYYAWKDFGY